MHIQHTEHRKGIAVILTGGIYNTGLEHYRICNPIDKLIKSCIFAIRIMESDLKYLERISNGYLYKTGEQANRSSIPGEKDRGRYSFLLLQGFYLFI